MNSAMTPMTPNKIFNDEDNDSLNDEISVDIGD